VEQSSNRNSAEYAMQRWREIDTLSMALSMPADHSVPPSWLLGKNRQPLKSVVFHQLAAQKRYTAASLNTWCPRTALHAVSATTEDFWRSRAPNAAVRFWRNARHPQRALTIRKGSTVSTSSRTGLPRDYLAPLQSAAKPYTLSGFKRSGQTMAMYTSPVLLGESQSRSRPSWGSL